MFAILIIRRMRDRAAEEQGVEMHVTPYIRKQAFLTPPEQQFYIRLMEAVGAEVIVCAKVRLADVIDVRADALDWRAAWNRIAAKHVDFLLVAPANQQPLLAIELDDSSHFQPRRQVRDEWLDRAMVAAGMPLLRVRVKRDYDPAALRRAIEQQILP